jgi:hypothetical protein
MSGPIFSPLPWEKFTRQQSAPAAMIRRRTSTDAEAGPTVAMIFVKS